MSEQKVPALFLAGKEIPLRFDMQAWEEIENTCCLIGDLGDRINQKGRLRLGAKVAAILAHDPQITEDWIFQHMRPADFRLLAEAVTGAIAQGLAMEQEQDDGEVRDVILDEIEKKETPEA